MKSFPAEGRDVPYITRDCDRIWGGEFREDGYFARTVGDRVTAEVIRKYTQYHCDHETTLIQLEWV